MQRKSVRDAVDNIRDGVNNIRDDVINIRDGVANRLPADQIYEISELKQEKSR